MSTVRRLVPSVCVTVHVVASFPEYTLRKWRHIRYTHTHTFLDIVLIALIVRGKHAYTDFEWNSRVSTRPFFMWTSRLVQAFPRMPYCVRTRVPRPCPLASGPQIVGQCRNPKVPLDIWQCWTCVRIRSPNLQFQAQWTKSLSHESQQNCIVSTKWLKRTGFIHRDDEWVE